MADNLELKDKPIGKSGQRILGNNYDDDDFAKKNPYESIVDLYKHMSNDPQCRKILQAIKNPIRSLMWSIDIGEDTPENKDIKQILELIFFNDIEWNEKLNEILTFLDQGHAIFEPVVENKIEPIAYTGLAALAWRSPESITEWKHNPTTGELLSIHQEQTGDVEVDVWIPAKNLLMLFNEKRGDNNGYSILRYLYPAWRRKKLMKQMEMVGIERFSLGVPKLKVPGGIRPDDEDYKRAIEIIKNFANGHDSYIAIPESYDLELWNNTGFDPAKLELSIKREDESMAGTILASFLELGTGGNSGAYSLGNNLESFFSRALNYYADYITRVINSRLIPPLIMMNVGKLPEVYPRLIHSDVSERSGLEFMQIITGLKKSGLIVRQDSDEEYLREKYRLPKMEEREDPVIVPNDPDGDPDNPDAPSGPDSDDEASDDSQDDHDIDKKEKKKTEETKEEQMNARSMDHILLSLDLKDARDFNQNIIRVENIMDSNTDILSQDMHEELVESAALMISRIIANYKKLPESRKIDAINDLNIPRVNLTRAIEYSLAQTASESMLQVRGEILPGVIMMADKLMIEKRIAAAKSAKDILEALPYKTRKNIMRRSKRLAQTKIDDLEDIVAFQFMATQRSSNDYKVMEEKMQNKAKERVKKSRQKVSASTTVASVLNDARMDYLFTPEITQQIYAFVFRNPNPITPICIRLNGRVFETNDREFLSYSPPLHPYCKSFLGTIPKTARTKPKIQGLPPINKLQKESIKF